VLALAAPAAAEDAFPIADDPALQALVEQAFAQSPELRAAAKAAAAAELRVPQAGALPDPMLGVGYDYGGRSLKPGADDDTGPTVTFSQELPYPGKRGLMARVEEQEARRAAQLAMRARLDVLYRVRKAYADLLQARENLALIEDQQRATRDIEELTRSRYAVGLADQSDVLRAQSELARLTQMRFHELGEQEAAIAELNRLTARPAGTAVETPRRLSELVRPGEVRLPAVEAVVERAEHASPEVAAGGAMVERAEAALALARRGLKPDFVVSAAYTNRGSMPGMASADVGIRLPLYAGRKQKRAVAEAELRLEGERAGREAMRLKVRSTAERSLADLRASVLEAQAYLQGVLVVDRLAVESSLASYRTGKVPFVAVLEAHNTLYRDRWQYAELLFDVLWHSAALDQYGIGI
jgi:outer membrane protein TolC